MTEITAIHISMPPWIRMWVIALTLFWMCKWAAWRLAGPGGAGWHPGRMAAWFFGWVGMDARAFFTIKARIRPPAAEWVAATWRMLGGAALLWLAAPMIAREAPLPAAWVGLVGLVLLIHFGAFDMLALLWRRAGRDVKPLMDQPGRARSLSEFWGRRWNTGFHFLAERFIWQPLAWRLGATAALLVTFLISGLVHELVITVPARGGWGGPTLYFLIQGIAIVAERRLHPRRRRWARVWVAAVTIGPLPLLFPRAFLLRVVIPMVQAMGAFHTGGLMPSLQTLLIVAGALHFCILCASALVPVVLDWRRSLLSLHPFNRMMVWVYGGFVVLTIIGFGTLCLTQSAALASGSSLARAVCSFVAIFWTARLLLQLFVMDIRPIVTSRLLRIGDKALTIVFSYFCIVFWLAAVAPRLPG